MFWCSLWNQPETDPGRSLDPGGYEHLKGRKYMQAATTDQQSEYQILPERALTCMRVNQVIVTLAVAMILAGIYVFIRWVARLPEPVRTIAGVSILVVFLLQLVSTLISPAIRFRRFRYRFDPECLEVIEGLIVIERHILPVTRIHQISIQQGPLDRYFRLAGLTITTAGGSVSINLLDETICKNLADQLTRRINSAVEAALVREGSV